MGTDPIGKEDRCVRESQSYDIKGVVTYSSNDGFICNVEKSILLNKLPKTFVKQDGQEVNVGKIGFEGTVEFTKRTSLIIPVYKLQNNECNLMNINEIDRTGNDFDLLAEDLAELAEDLCGGTINVKKLIDVITNNKHKLIAINGIPNHVHLFIGYNPHQLVPGLLQDIKGFCNK